MKRTSYFALGCFYTISISLGVLGCSSKENITGDPIVAADTQNLDVRKPMAQIDTAPLVFDPKLAFFHSNEANLTSEAKKALIPTVHFMKQNPGVRLVVEGYCDERGSDAYNIKLGQRRADSVKRFLTSEGIPDSSVDTVSYGRVMGSGKKTWAQNRRTGFQMIYPKED